jgi:hypothetical protein
MFVENWVQPIKRELRTGFLDKAVWANPLHKKICHRVAGLNRIAVP